MWRYYISAPGLGRNFERSDFKRKNFIALDFEFDNISGIIKVNRTEIN
jgi:hypothetical protein